MENNEPLAPLVARILSTLILIGKRGVTFESLVAKLSANKSNFIIFNHFIGSKEHYLSYKMLWPQKISHPFPDVMFSMDVYEALGGWR